MTDIDRIALVTGANKGIGLEIVRQLAQAGATVFLGARDRERGQNAVGELTAAGHSVEFLQIDVNDTASVAAAADAIGATRGRLDILVNNAGIADAEDGPASTVPLAVVRRVLETNFFGALTVTRAMLPLLRQSSRGRIVNMSSPLGSMAVHCDPSSPYYAYRLLGYNLSKAALNLLTLELAAELDGSGIAVNAVAPGFVRTDLTGHQGMMEADEGAKAPVRYALLDEPVTGGFFGPEGALDW